MSPRTAVGGRSLVAYFVLAYALSWGAVVAVVGPDGLPAGATTDEGPFLTVVLAQLAGPVVGGLGLVVATRGTAGLGELWRRQRRVRVDARWYALALLTTPALLTVVVGLLFLTSPAYAPAILTADDRLALVTLAVGGGLLVAFFEELGWTGFALPALRDRYALLTAGLVLGLLWGAWHGLADYWGNAAAYGGLWPLRIGLWVVALTAYRIVIAWVHEHTRSLFLAQLTHASFVAGQALVGPAQSTPGEYLRWYGLFAVTLWVVVAAIWMGRRRS